MNESKKITLNDVPDGDYYQIIYFLEDDDNNEYAYSSFNPQMNEKGEYYEITFKDMMDEIEAKHNKKICSFTMIAESGLDGTVYRYNNYGKGEILVIGSTRGYA